MKQTILLFAIALLLGIQSYAQTGVAINTTGADPDTSAMLDVSSTEKGVLVPRMTEAQRTVITTPAIGLLVYQTDTPEGFYFFDGTSWNYLASANGTAPGQMQYWNGTAWVTVAAGTHGQVFEFRNGAPLWVDKNINTLSIGDTYQGGIIAYFLQPGDPGYDANVKHGLIAAPLDQSSSALWGCFGLTIGGTGTGIGTGAANTAAIVAGCVQSGNAARICNDLELNGYSDWYLPSKDELNQVFLSKDLIGGFPAGWYWSSSESDKYYAWRQYFPYGSTEFFGKGTYWRVRAVRAF